MGKKKILILTGWLPGGGAEKVLIDILRHIDYTRYEVDLALYEKKGVLLKEVPSEVNIIELWGPGSAHHFWAIKSTLYLHNNLMLSQRINGKRLKSDYDAEIAFLEGMPVKLISMRKSSAPKYCWVHVDLSRFHNSKTSFYNAEEEKNCYGKMKQINCVSEDCRKGFIECFPDMASKTKVIYNPIDKENIISQSNEDGFFLKTEEGKINVITLARLHSQKNPHRMLDVAALAAKEGLSIKFHWLGEGDMEEEILKARKERGLEDIIEFYGFRKNPYPYIKQADMMVLPSDAEGFGLVLCEAMCLDVPVISTPTAGPAEIIGDNENGLLTDFTPESILEAVKRLAKDKELRERLILNGRKRVEDFSVENTMQGIYRLMEE